MERPSTSQHHHSTEKIEVFQVREAMPYQAEVTRAPTAYDEESGEDVYASSWESAWNAICQLFNLFHHMQIAIVVFVMWHYALTSVPNGGITNQQLHIIFAGTGYQFFLAEAVLTLHKHNSWSFRLSDDGKRIVHGCLQLIGALFVISGTCLALASTNMSISTAHGICGVVALAFSLVSFVSGVIALFSPKVRLRIKSGPVKIFHSAFGLIALMMGLITICIGFHMPAFAASRSGLSTALIAFISLSIFYIIIQPITDIVKAARNL